MTLSASIPVLKRRAKLLSRHAGIPLAAALDCVAASEGWRSWSLLSVRAAESSLARAFFARLWPSDLALLGGRPGQGKTF
jgi:hypothetical protein